MGSFFSSSRNAVIDNKSRIPRRNSQTNEVQLQFFLAEHADVQFKDLVKRFQIYKDLMEASAKYDVYISHRKLHWFLIFKLSNSELPFLTIEITRGDDKVSFLAFMEALDDVTDKEYITTETMTLYDVCDAADTVKKKMGQYDIIKNNCQHFCNNLLKWLNYEQFPTTSRFLLAEKTTLGYDELGFDTQSAIVASRQSRS